MPSEFKLSVPTNGDAPLTVDLKIGSTLYLLGGNGTGKSSLVAHFFSQYSQFSKRIAAHRQTWLESNTLNITPHGRQELEDTFRSQDRQAKARYSDWNPSSRTNIAIFDLIDADTMQAYKIADFVRSGNDTAAKREAETLSPLQLINELMRLSNLPIEISLEEGQKVIARKNGGIGYSIAELSDGERNAFLIASDVLTAKAGTLILIDEPERHLHRSIISPLLRLLFEKRKDCAFLVSTHDLMLVADTPEATTMLVRNCEYEGQNVRSWTIDIVPPGVGVDEELKRDLLGARRKMLFVEGTGQSLDAPLYSLLFPQVSVIPKETCRDVEYAVRGLRGAPDMHWIAAYGIVDNDQRSQEEIVRLQSVGVWALSHYSVEALYYHLTIVTRVAERQAEVNGADAPALVKPAIDNAIAAVNVQKDHLVASAVLRSARDKILSNLPRRDDIINGQPINIGVDVALLRREEESRFDALIAEKNWNGLLTRYPLRESSAFDRIVSGIKISDKDSYRGTVLKLLQDDSAALADLRGLLGGIYEKIVA